MQQLLIDRRDLSFQILPEKIIIKEKNASYRNNKHVF